MRRELVRIDGTKYWGLKGDTDVTAKCIRHRRLDWSNTWRTRQILDTLAEGDVVLDIGANIGATTKIFLDRGCEVWSFEAFPDAFECLCRNCPGAHCRMMIVGDGREAALDWSCPDDRCGQRAAVSGAGQPTVCIDDVVQGEGIPKIAAVKIDVEGYEPHVLDGMANTIKRDRPVLMLEVNDRALKRQGFTREDLENRIRSLGYSIDILMGDPSEFMYDALCLPT